MIRETYEAYQVRKKYQPFVNLFLHTAHTFQDDRHGAWGMEIYNSMILHLAANVNITKGLPCDHRGSLKAFTYTLYHKDSRM